MTTRPDWWPKNPWPIDEFPDGPGALKGAGWAAADAAIYERLEREMHNRAIALETRKEPQ